MGRPFHDLRLAVGVFKSVEYLTFSTGPGIGNSSFIQLVTIGVLSGRFEQFPVAGQASAVL